MSIARSRRFCLVLAVLLTGSLQWAGSPGDAGARGASRPRVTQVIAVRAHTATSRASSSSLRIICNPDPCAGNTTGPSTNGIVIGHAFTPDAIRAGAVHAGSLGTLAAHDSAASALPLSSASTETISISGAAWLATATFVTSLQTPPVTVTVSNPDDSGPVGTTAPDGTIMFSHVPIVIGPTYVVTVTSQSPKRNAVAYFHLKLPAKH